MISSRTNVGSLVGPVERLGKGEVRLSQWGVMHHQEGPLRSPRKADGCRDNHAHMTCEQCPLPLSRWMPGCPHSTAPWEDTFGTFPGALGSLQHQPLHPGHSHICRRKEPESSFAAHRASDGRALPCFAPADPTAAAASLIRLI